MPEVEDVEPQHLVGLLPPGRKFSFTWATASIPPTQTSSKERSSTVTSSSAANRRMWKGFSKSAGALGVMTKALPSGRQHPGQLGGVGLGVGEVLDQVRRADPVEGPRRPATASGVALGHPQPGGPYRAVASPAASSCSRRRPRSVGAGELGRLEALAAADVQHPAGAQPVADGLVAGGVEGQQRVGGHPLSGRSPVSLATVCIRAPPSSDCRRPVRQVLTLTGAHTTGRVPSRGRVAHGDVPRRGRPGTTT